MIRVMIYELGAIELQRTLVFSEATWNLHALERNKPQVNLQFTVVPSCWQVNHNAKVILHACYCAVLHQSIFLLVRSRIKAAVMCESGHLESKSDSRHLESESSWIQIHSFFPNPDSYFLALYLNPAQKALNPNLDSDSHITERQNLGYNASHNQMRELFLLFTQSQLRPPAPPFTAIFLHD